MPQEKANDRETNRSADSSTVINRGAAPRQLSNPMATTALAASLAQAQAPSQGQAQSSAQAQSQAAQASTSGADLYSNTSSLNHTVKQNAKRKKRPVIQKTPSYNFPPGQSKYIYSVDDDADELELDMEREYLEGYNDALRYRYKKSTKNLKDAADNDDIQNLTSEVVTNLINADANLRKLENRESDSHKHQTGDDHGLTARGSRLTSNIQAEQVSNFDEDDEIQTITPKDSQRQTEPEQYDAGDGPEDDDDDNDDKNSISSEESFTLRARQDAINETHPFGIRIWKPALYKKVRSVQREADKDIHDSGSVKKNIGWQVYFTNLIWSLTVGLIFFILCMIGTAILVISGSTAYAKVMYNLGAYLMFPFGKVVYLKKDENYLSEDRNEGTTVHEYERWRDGEQNKLFFSSAFTHNNGNGPSDEPMTPSLQPHNGDNLANSQRLAPLRSVDRGVIEGATASGNDDYDDDDHRKLRFFGRGDWSLARIVFYVYFYIILEPLFLIVWLACWLGVITIPMAKVVQTLTDHLRRHPLAIFYKFDSVLPSERVKDSNILICTYRSCGWHYYKYTIEGTNIFFINLMAVVIFTIVDFYFLKEFLELNIFITNESVVFQLCLLSIIPLAYFIGQAVASISAQSSMGVGAVINAFFSTVVEIFLYCVALNQEKGSLVEGSLIGSILAAVLLLPGMSMCAGAFIRKTQRYNPASAGVSCTMLLFSLCVMFAPTIFHQIYGTYEIECTPCKNISSEVLLTKSCQTCHFFQPPLQIDQLFKQVLKPYSVVCAILLFLAYTVGLWFTLRTHAALIWQTPISDPKPKLPATPSAENVLISHHSTPQQTSANAAPEAGGHDAPNWSRSKSTIVLLGATLLYAVIAEILVDCVDSVLANFPINPKFLGITIFALVPNTTEFLNAISFATHGNVALSMEIGSAYALQVCLIQIPSLVLYSLFFINPEEFDTWNIKDKMFTLIFPNWDVIASVVSVMLFTYIYAEGKSNYFKGSILILIYCVVMIGFYYTGRIESNGLAKTAFTVMNDLN